MPLASISFGDQQPITTEHAFCVPDTKTVCTLGDNRHLPAFCTLSPKVKR